MVIDWNRESKYLTSFDFDDAIKEADDARCYYKDCSGVMQRHSDNGYNYTTKRQGRAGWSATCSACGATRWVQDSSQRRR